MKKKIDIKKFIPLQIAIMILVAIVYFGIVPKIKPMCASQTNVPMHSIVTVILEIVPVNIRMKMAILKA